jgi:hypothetical protein
MSMDVPTLHAQLLPLSILWIRKIGLDEVEIKITTEK